MYIFKKTNALHYYCIACRCAKSMLSKEKRRDMSLTHNKDQVLNKVVLRMPKCASSFFYFALESNENIAFYSTLPFEKHQQYRDIEIFSSPELYSHLTHLIEHYQETCQIQKLSEEKITDSL